MSICVRTAHAVAADSPDHTCPRGTALDSSRNPRFNQKLYTLFRSLGRPIRILDLGCAGGGFVRDCLDDGHVAIGIEGSDYSSASGRAEWPALGGRALFTADITKPFEIVRIGGGGDVPVRFDVVSLWEVLEHIPQHDLPDVFANIRAHLEPGGLVIASISTLALPHHQTVHDEAWWASLVEREELVPVQQYVQYFATQFVRGPKYGAPGSFHIIATADRSRVPAIPAPRLITQLLDRAWYGSAVQQTLSRSIVGR